jgi:hypothetical protein
MGGTNDKENLVLLTAREHFLAHWLLWRIHRNRESAFSFNLMCGRNKSYSSKAYAEAKEAFSKYMSEFGKTRIGYKNSMFGKKQKESTKKKISNKSKIQCKGSKNPKARKLYQYDINKNLIKIWNCCKDCYGFYGVSASRMSVCAIQNTNFPNHQTLIGFIFSFNLLNGYNNVINKTLFEQSIPQQLNKYIPIKLYQYDLEFNLIKIWPSRKSFLKNDPKIDRRFLYKIAEYNSKATNSFKELNKTIISFNEIKP